MSNGPLAGIVDVLPAVTHPAAGIDLVHQALQRGAVLQQHRVGLGQALGGGQLGGTDAEAQIANTERTVIHIQHPIERYSIFSMLIPPPHAVRPSRLPKPQERSPIPLRV